MDWIQATQLVGVPVVILMGIAAGFVRACRWCAPRIDRFLDGHQQLLAKTAEIQEEIRLLVIALGRRVEEHDTLEIRRLDVLQSGLDQLTEFFDSSFQHRKGA